ncbi:prolyl aminopeptidase [Thalassotalea sp. 1_MG-2023]|uniref:prolyl aminopeptidase n=1 Tax=Thalassotalea sp. 1_MG-2023 TaxID=3062680 RepID=UPI0026E12598|nr:prolyl aminopeptidase [Thalassotalea sp. 1_MG-2023]MDO6426159.1 prolyl aminopeptidase [Thalassotalea sp. 1_MG-2023]
MTRILNPKISPFHTEFVDVGEQHQIYLEQAGNVKGIPVLYLHGGPGGGTSENHRRYFDPEKYHYISFDQRGCGQSTPAAEIENNTSEKLIDDIEFIRRHLKIEQWLVVGGSWGTTLALLYGIEHPQRVLGFILRGVFLATQQEYNWLYKPDGVQGFFPDYYQDFISPLDEAQKLDPIKGYGDIFAGDNELAKSAACKAWYLWELRLSSIEHPPLGLSQVEDFHQACCMAKISQHYFQQKSFIKENYIIENINKISNIPAIVIHGRYDMVCQLQQAYKLVEHWPSARLQILPQAGHSGFESQTIDAMCKATDVMADFLRDK